MTLLYSDPLFLEHRTGRHPECPQRVEAILARLERGGLVASCTRPAWAPISRERLLRCHAAPYVDQVQQFAAAGGGQIESDTVLSERSADAALLAAGTAADAVARVLNGEDKQALCLVRPPGHHALPAHAMGFCLFNNVAVAARTAVAEFGLRSVLIVDWDVHHGNGTQDAFYADPVVGFFSIHRWPFYPGTGRATETGSGPGLGRICNVPVEYGVSRRSFRDLFASHLRDLAAKLRPELILVSAGFDAHREDPVGSLGLEVEDFGDLTDVVVGLAQEHAGGRLVSLLEGGYNVVRLAECVELHLETLLEAQRK